MSPLRSRSQRRLTVRIVGIFVVVVALGGILRAGSFTRLPNAVERAGGMRTGDEVVDDSYAEDVRTATQRLENVAFQALTSWPTLPTAIRDVEGSVLLPLFTRGSEDGRVVLIVSRTYIEA